MHSSIAFFLTSLLLIISVNNTQANNPSSASIYPAIVNGFNGNLLEAKEDLYGNKYLVINHSGPLLFNNDTVQSGGTALYKTDPIGNLIWNTPAINGFYIITKLIETPSEMIVYGFYFDSLNWGNYSVYHNGNNFTTPYGLRCKIDKDGQILSLEDFPIGSYGFGQEDVIHQDDGFYITSSFDSIMQFGPSTILENPISEFNNESDRFLAFFDSVANPVWIINLGGAAFEGITDLNYSNSTNSILLSGFFAKPPDSILFYPDSSFLYLEIGMNGNILNSRSLEIELSTYWTFKINDLGTIITREYNDSSEGIFSANTIYQGQDHFGYYVYNSGLFLPPTSGTAYGANSFDRQDDLNSQFIVDKTLVSDVLIHPSGMISDGSTNLNAPYSINGFDIDSMNFIWNLGTNKEFVNRSLKSGSQFLTRKLNPFNDSIVSIDSIQIVKNAFEPALLFVNIVHCDYFEPQIFINRMDDSLEINLPELDIQWFFNNQPISGANINKIKLIGSGNYHAELSNYYGCVDYSDTISVISGLNDEEYGSFKVYPNPANDYLRFKSDLAESTTIDIYDIRGKFIRRETMEEELILNIANWSPGIYIYKIESDNGIFNGKFIKQ